MTPVSIQILTFPISQKGVVSWKELLDLGKATSDTNLDNRLANIAINQVFGSLHCIFWNKPSTDG